MTPDISEYTLEIVIYENLVIVYNLTSSVWLSKVTSFLFADCCDHLIISRSSWTEIPLGYAFFPHTIFKPGWVLFGYFPPKHQLRS